MIIDPLTVCIYDHQLYVIGRRQNGQRRLYRFSRILSADETGFSFTYPTKSEYDPARLLAKSFGVFAGDDIDPEPVEVLLDKEWQTHATTHRWHPSQEVHINADGKVLVRFHVGVCPELEAWILGFAEQATVIRPERLREKVKSRLAAAACNYRQ